MSKIIVFVHVHGRPGLIEIALPEEAKLIELHNALRAAGVQVDTEMLVFVDAEEHHHAGDVHTPLCGLQHGCHIHMTRCRQIKTTVNFQHRTAEREFPPGVRLRLVKEWSVREFKMSPHDASEHVLQVCNSGVRPTSDTPLQSLVDERHCSLCFDLVPEKRVEGC